MSRIRKASRAAAAASWSAARSSLAALDPEVRARVNAQIETNEAFIAGLIREGQADGSIPGHVDVDDTARLMICITQGMRVVGKARLPLDGDRLVGVAMKLLA